MPPTRPIVIAHRGASGYLPEHTLAAKAYAHAVGADFLEQDVVLTCDDIPIVLHHHEDWRGGGYPIGISGERIPVGARIIRLCETYDALTSERAYRAAHTPAEALKVIAAGSDRQFEPRVVQAFLRMMRRPPVRDEILSRWDTLESTARAWRIVVSSQEARR